MLNKEKSPFGRIKSCLLLCSLLRGNSIVVNLSRIFSLIIPGSVSIQQSPDKVNGGPTEPFVNYPWNVQLQIRIPCIFIKDGLLVEELFGFICNKFAATGAFKFHIIRGRGVGKSSSVY